MSIVSVDLDFLGRKLPFSYPREGNVTARLKNVLGGKCYPVPPLPKNYKFETIVDIGANVGASALWFLTAAPTARIVCFEPGRENAECLRRNLSRFDAAEIFDYGLYSSDREVKLHLGRHHCMEHSIFANSETGSETETIVLKRASIEFERLGLKRISILKIDTEGCEVPILHDLGPRLSDVDMIYLEWHSDEDRREIDTLHGDRFVLAGVESVYPHRGEALYLSKLLADQSPKIASMRIQRPPEA